MTEIDPATLTELGGIRRSALAVGGFPDRYWAAKWHAYRVLHEFTETGWRTPFELVMDPLWAGHRPHCDQQ